MSSHLCHRARVRIAPLQPDGDAGRAFNGQTERAGSQRTGRHIRRDTRIDVRRGHIRSDETSHAHKAVTVVDPSEQENAVLPRRTEAADDAGRTGNREICPDQCTVAVEHRNFRRRIGAGVEEDDVASRCRHHRIPDTLRQLGGNGPQRSIGVDAQKMQLSRIADEDVCAVAVAGQFLQSVTVRLWSGLRHGDRGACVPIAIQTAVPDCQKAGIEVPLPPSRQEPIIKRHDPGRPVNPVRRRRHGRRADGCRSGGDAGTEHAYGNNQSFHSR